MFAAIGLGWLAPFHYFGVADVIEYDDSLLNAGRTGYDAARLTTVLSTEPRVDLAIKHFRNHASNAALGFCVSIDHARYMARMFSAAGIPALAVHSGPDSADRVKAVQELTASRVSILFVVDLFNEGVDIPCVDLVMFLRPTESMTVFVQQLGRGLGLHEGKQRLIVLDFIGNYRRAQHKLPFLTRIEDDSPEAIAAALRALSVQSTSSFPDGVEITLERLAVDRLRSVMEAPGSLREALKAEFHRLQTELGRRPSLVDIERRARYPGRQYRLSFSTWLGAIEACGGLTDNDRTLQGSNCLAFLNELAVLDTYVAANPINAWIGGNTTAASLWFAYDAGTRTFSYIGPMASEDAAFAAAIKERVAWRLETYLSRPGPGRNTYKVIPNGNSACIMLGNASSDGLPRSGGWKVVKINGAFRYAKFARVAINWIAAEPDGDNVILPELQKLLGSDLLEFNRPQRVMMAAESDSDCWQIRAV